MDDAVDVARQGVHEIPIRQIGGNPANARALARRVGAVQGVDPMVRPQRLDEMTPDEAACAGDEQLYLLSLAVCRGVSVGVADGGIPMDRLIRSKTAPTASSE